MIRRILLPVDTDRDCRAPMRYAAGLASSVDADLYLLNVERSGRSASVWESGTARRAKLSGRPAETIADYANAIEADLILMPTRGRGLLGQMLFGSTTMDVLRLSTRPLWVVKPASLMTGVPPRRPRILCGIDLGSQSEAVLSYASGWASAEGGDLLVAHAVPEIGESMLTLNEFDRAGTVELRPEEARGRLLSMAAKTGVRCEVEVGIGDVAPVLRKAAKRWRADFIIVGRGRRTGRRQLSANIGDILAQSPCPVITWSGNIREIRPVETGMLRRGMALSRKETPAPTLDGRYDPVPVVLETV